ncbi:hypothetical protein [Aureispira anguillae]|uniref:Right handed beta helix domain-containing protein n=1 Tax=Aureispira anguillae TaxID=2864201 RepID=A0A915YIK4_9BACT|nr:hypothetical protein [Aureispira anguillae]BDS13858.1 hypothetical protein AsAng_0046200 [Aureispira anguillae]
MQFKIFKYSLFIAISALLIQLTACTKNQFITTSGAGLEFSLDTLTFDTVFTNLGNATRRFKVYNPHNQIIRINNVYLGGGNQSDFKINIDGFTGSASSDIEIPAKDSIYIFANVRIDPSNGDAIRLDSILFETDGGGMQKVILHAYGWNANYIGKVGYLTRITSPNQTLTLSNTKPYIFMGIISVDSSSCLVIPGGTEIYMFGGPTTRPGDRAMLYIGHNSCIRSNVGGNLNNPVIFKTHRLEEDYQLITFHHNGIYLSTTSRDNIIHGTIIRNAVDGIFVDSFSTNGSPKLELHNSKIYNVERSGVLGRGGHIQMTNTVIANSNQFNFIGIRGGVYNFAHCTFANVGAGLVSRSEPILSYRNYEIQIINNVETAVSDVGIANFTNCILYGTKNEEIEVLQVPSALNFTYNFTNCLMKVDTFSQNMTDCITNQDPIFVDEDNFDYNIDTTGSPANDAGIVTSLNTDIIGQVRHPIDPAIGAYAIPD